jgi:SAM-dependent methyltransferase
MENIKSHEGINMIPVGRVYREYFFRQRAKHQHFVMKIPLICEAIISQYDPSTMIDVGCGLGEFISYFIDRGVDAYGLEGTDNCIPYIHFPKEKLILADLRLPLEIGRKFDIVLSFEVAEHIEPEYADVFCDNLVALSDLIVMTAAPPRQGGYCHVNCQEKPYWIEKFNERSFDADVNDMNKLSHSWESLCKDRETLIYILNLMVFKRRKVEA